MPEILNCRRYGPESAGSVECSDDWPAQGGWETHFWVERNLGGKIEEDWTD